MLKAMPDWQDFGILLIITGKPQLAKWRLRRMIKRGVLGINKHIDEMLSNRIYDVTRVLRL